MSSPHGAESQEAIEQCMQQIIGHIRAKSHRSPLSGSFPLLSWTSFRSAEKQKRQRDKRRQWYIKHYRQTLEKRGRGVGGWNWYYSDYSDFTSCFSNKRTCNDAHPRPFRSAGVSMQTRQRKARGQWCHSHDLASRTESGGHRLPFEYKSNLALPSTWGWGKLD